MVYARLLAGLGMCFLTAYALAASGSSAGGLSVGTSMNKLEHGLHHQHHHGKPVKKAHSIENAFQKK